MLPFLANASLTVVGFLVVITVIVTLHELGHFLTARSFGVAVDRFSIGFGPTLWARRDRSGVEWRVAWLPLGGYVRFAGDENVASVPDDSDLDALKAEIRAKEGAGAERKYFVFKPLWQRALVVAAGPATNFVLAVALFALLFATMGEMVSSLKVNTLMAGSPAIAAGIRQGDVVTSIDGHPMGAYDDLQAYVQDRAGVPMQVSVMRAGKSLDVSVTPATIVRQSPAGGDVKVGQLGVYFEAHHQTYNPVEAVGRGATMTWSVVSRTFYYVGRMVDGKSGWPFSGLIGTAHVAGALTQQAVDDSQSAHEPLGLTFSVQYIYLAALLSTSIGLVNLLPIPVLDGGHLLFYAWEAVARRPLPVTAQMAGYRVGLALLVGLMLFTAWHDLQRMQVFHFLGVSS